jgi:hypothetical protein
MKEGRRRREKAFDDDFTHTSIPMYVEEKEENWCLIGGVLLLLLFVGSDANKQPILFTHTH